jgi:hypothetical protein
MNNRYSALRQRTMISRRPIVQCRYTETNQLSIQKITEQQKKIINDFLNGKSKISFDKEKYDFLGKYHDFTEEDKERIICISENQQILEKTYSNNDISVNFKYMFVTRDKKKELNFILKTIFDTIFYKTKWMLIPEMTFNSNRFIGGYYLLIENDKNEDLKSKSSLIKWVIRNCCTTYLSETNCCKPLFNIDNKRLFGTSTIYLKIGLTLNLTSTMKEILNLIPSHFNQLLSKIGPTEYEIVDEDKIKDEDLLIDEQLSKLSIDLDKNKDEVLKLIKKKKELKKCLESLELPLPEYTKKGYGSKIKADIKENYINFIIPFKYNSKLTGFDQLLFPIIEMIYTLIIFLNNNEESVTEKSLQNFLIKYLQGNEIYRPKLYLNILDGDKRSSNSPIMYTLVPDLIFCREKCGERFQFNIEKNTLSKKNEKYFNKQQEYIKSILRNEEGILTLIIRYQLDTYWKLYQQYKQLKHTDLTEIVTKIAKELVENKDGLQEFNIRDN